MPEYENKLVDKRVVARYIQKGLVDEKDYEQLLKKLPDLESQALPMDAAMDLDDFELDDEDESDAAETPKA